MKAVAPVPFVLIPVDFLGCIGSMGLSRCLLISLFVLPLVWLLPLVLPPLIAPFSGLLLPSVPFLLSVSPSVFGHRRHRRHRPLRSHHRDSMLFAWVLEQISRWRPYTVVAARSQMAPPLVDEALLLLRVPLVDQWSCRVKSARTSVDPQMTI